MTTRPNSRLVQPAMTKNRVREFREARGLSQEQLGELLGTEPSTVSRLERGDRKLTEPWLRRLGKALDVPAGELLAEAGGKDGAKLDVESELKALEDLIAALRLVRTNESATAALLDAVADQVGKLRAKMPAG